MKNELHKFNRMKKLITYRFLPVVFVILLIIPGINSIFKIVSDSENLENRKLSELPEFIVARLDPFPNAYEDYYNDHFFMRNLMNSLWSEFSIKYLKKSPSPKSIIGKNGWLYMTESELDSYLAKNLFTAQQLDSFVNEIKKRVNYLSSVGTKYYFVVAPTKYSIYPEYLPSLYQVKKRFTRTDQIINALSNIRDVNIIDLRKSLLKHKQEYEVFRRTDNHWNSFGAYFAYCDIINKIRIDFPDVIPAYPLDSFNIESLDVKGGNIATIINGEYIFREKHQPKIEFIHPKVFTGKSRGYPVIKGFAYPWEYEIVDTSTLKTVPKALIIRDSFGGALRPFLSSNFSESVYIFDAWQYKLNKAIVDNEKPDIFIQLTLECHYHNILDHIEEY